MEREATHTVVITEGERMTVSQALSNFRKGLEADPETVKHDADHIEDVKSLESKFAG